MMLAIMVTLILLVVCFTVGKRFLCINSRYAIYERSGKTYMRLFRNMIQWNPEYCELGKYRYPEFSSLSEMKHMLLSGDISDVSLGGIQFREDQRFFEICSLNDLYTACLPDGLSVSTVVLSRMNYSFKLTDAVDASCVYIADDTYGSLTCADYESYMRQYNSIFVDLAGENRTVFKEEDVPDRDGHVTYFKVEDGYYRNAPYDEIDVCYQIATEQGYTYVSERYSVNWTFYADGPQQEPTASSELECIYICGTSGNRYFYGSIRNLAERPSVEWLASFGLQEFAENGN